MKKVLFTVFVIPALLLTCLSSCVRYSSHYMAVGFVHSNTPDSAAMSFSSFEGTMVFKLKCEGRQGDCITYGAVLESGSAKIYYDCGDGKTELFEISSGCDLNDRSGELKKGTVYIIVETDEKCTEGIFSFLVVNTSETD